jgi:predicted hotdog family 3-hydroxylacyl-ACP dehydratase
LEQQQLDAQIPHEEAIVNEDEVETQDDDQVKSQQEVALRRSTR